jgi:hypothetical protein
MSRPKVRHASLDAVVAQQLLTLFGTVRNAHTRLGLSLDVPYMTFYRAMAGNDITREQQDVILERWELWRKTFMHPDCPPDDELTLHPIDKEILPEWSHIPPETGKRSPTRSGKS